MHIRLMLIALKQRWSDRRHALTSEEAQKIAAYAELLPEPDRTIFVLWRYYDMPTVKIAKRLHIQRDQVRDSLTKSYATMLVTVLPREEQAPPRDIDDIAGTEPAAPRPCHRTSGAELAPVPGSSPPPAGSADA